jgi:hypothetical protein
LGTCIETAFIALFRTTAGKGDVSIPSVLIDVGAIRFLTTDEQDLWTRSRMLHPIIVEKFGERGRVGEVWGERKAWRRDYAEDEGYCGATGLWRKKDGSKVEGRRNKDGYGLEEMR